MKKTLSLVLAFVLVLSCAPTAFASQTTLTTTVPDATYTLNIPADQTIVFGATETNIGDLSVSDATGFAEGKNLDVTIEYTAFSASGVSTTIPYTLYPVDNQGSTSSTACPSGTTVHFAGKTDGTTTTLFGVGVIKGDKESLKLVVESEAWGKALGGTYTSTITFTAEVVVSES